MNIVAASVALIAAASASNAEAKDIVAAAANAIIARDADSLKAMRFDAFDRNGKPLSVDGLLNRIDRCRRIDLSDQAVSPYPRKIHFECDESQDDRGPCDDTIMIVALDRATSPDVSAQLRFKRLETSACALPPVPRPMSLPGV